LIQGVLAALLQREHTGAGAVVEVSLFDSLVEWMSYPIYYATYGGSAPERMGLAHPTVVPYDAFPTQDGGSVIIAIQNDAGWAALARNVLDRPDLVDDPRFTTNVARAAHRQEVDDLVCQRTRGLSAVDLADLLRSAGIAQGQVRDVASVAEHVQLVERGRWASVDSPVGSLRALLPPLSPGTWAPRMEPIPALGEHSDAILRELGYDDTARAAMRSEGVVT
jgi:crotonobetainyl-CoA:carnitine CoA-transferase CaiB-like acyl-CoA transferase